MPFHVEFMSSVARASVGGEPSRTDQLASDSPAPTTAWAIASLCVSSSSVAPRSWAACSMTRLTTLAIS